VDVDEVGAGEVVDGHLERIAAVNPSVNAVTNPLTDPAREAAKEMSGRGREREGGDHGQDGKPGEE
jgi:amidase